MAITEAPCSRLVSSICPEMETANWRAVCGKTARRWFNLLMKLPKPLWNRALQVFFRQQIFLAKKNPWNSDYMRVSSEWWSCINRLSQRLALYGHPVKVNHTAFFCRVINLAIKYMIKLIRYIVFLYPSTTIYRFEPCKTEWLDFFTEDWIIL